MKVCASRSAVIERSPRVMQVEAMFDVTPSQRQDREWRVDLPIESRDWNVGLIVGPSGCGKSTLAREAWGDEKVLTRFEWSDHAIVDDFPSSLATKDVLDMLGSVGLNSPPAWMRPFATLSTGEQFRAHCARAIAENTDLIVLDEFTSVVDRPVAKIASHTIAKTVRRRDRQLVAVSCHYDVVDWLQPDWVYQPHADDFQWRHLQPRPTVDISVHKIRGDVWPLFGPHHYLSGDLLNSSTCFGGFVDGEIVAFAAYRHFPHATTRTIKMGHRLVVLPDWQGLGIGLAMFEWVGQTLAEQGFRFRNVTAHPAMIYAHARSPRWQFVKKTTMGRVKPGRTAAEKNQRAQALSPRRLNTRVYEYRPPAI